MVMGHWSVAILFWQLSMDHIVNVQCKRCGLAKIRLRYRSLPFDSLPYSTRTIRRHVRTLGQSRDNQTKRGWPYSMSMGLCPRVGAPLQIVNEGKCRLDANRKLSPWKMTPSTSLTIPRKLGYLKDSNAVAHSVDTGIECPMYMLESTRIFAISL